MATWPVTLPMIASRPREALSASSDGRVHGAQHAEDVRLELPPVVVEGRALDRAHHAEAGVGDHHVEAAEGVPGGRHGALEVAVDGDVAGERRGRGRPLALELGGQRGEAIRAAGDEREVGALTGELAGQRRADPGRGAGDQDRLAVAKRVTGVRAG